MNEELLSTLKSLETEGWFDLHIVRPAAFHLAKFFARIGVHPNAVSIVSMVVGAASAFLFIHASWYYEGASGVLANVIGVLMLLFAAVLDCVDGQLARMTGKCTKLGRILDGAASIFWYIPIYIVIIFRFYHHHSIEFGWFGIADTQTNVIIATVIVGVLVHLSGYVFLMGQERIADYYIQIHLLFQKGEKGSELDSSDKLTKIYDATPWKGNFIDKLSQSSYISYTRLQEKRTPAFQKMMKRLRSLYGSADNIPQEFRDRFHSESLKLMGVNNLLTFNFRTLFLALFFILDIPVAYFVFEVVFMTLLREYVIRRHENICGKLLSTLPADNNG